MTGVCGFSLTLVLTCIKWGTLGNDIGREGADTLIYLHFLLVRGTSPTSIDLATINISIPYIDL